MQSHLHKCISARWGNCIIAIALLLASAVPARPITAQQLLGASPAVPYKGVWGKCEPYAESLCSMLRATGGRGHLVCLVAIVKGRVINHAIVVFSDREGDWAVDNEIGQPIHVYGQSILDRAKYFIRARVGFPCLILPVYMDGHYLGSLQP